MIPTIVGWDTTIERLIDTGRTPELVRVFEWITWLGDARVITVVTISVLFVLWRHRKWEYKLGFLVSLLGALGSSYLIKILIERPRPPFPFPALIEQGYSFPSMHATVAMATYGFLAYIVFKIMRPPHHRAPVIALLLALIPLVGFSRVYLGVHYTSDVLAGFVVGVFFVWLGILATKRLTRK